MTKENFWIDFENRKDISIEIKNAINKLYELKLEKQKVIEDFNEKEKQLLSSFNYIEKNMKVKIYKDKTSTQTFLSKFCFEKGSYDYSFLFIFSFFMVNFVILSLQNSNTFYFLAVANITFITWFFMLLDHIYSIKLIIKLYETDPTSKELIDEFINEKSLSRQYLIDTKFKKHIMENIYPDNKDFVLKLIYLPSVEEELRSFVNLQKKKK